MDEDVEVHDGTNMAAALIGLGANQPFSGVEGAALLKQALEAMSEQGLTIMSVSSAWRSSAWPPGSGQPDYVNAVAEVDAGVLGPEAIFARLRAIETAFGRVRRERWGPRTLDLDLLALDGCVGQFGEIALPHRRLHERAFVLAPLAEIAPAWRHPLLGASAVELLTQLGSDSAGAVRLQPLA
jgi:2-amino-4-hydroxy-6-hydroxymethyldihydropteridine diphosphokinase